MGEARDFQTTIGLLRRARSGERGALEDLFARYLPKVRRIVALRLGHPLRDFALYEDIVQESLLRTFEKLETFEEMSEGTFQNWVASCVMTAINLHFKRHGARKRGGGKVRPLGGLASEGLSASIFKAKGAGPSTIASDRELEERIEAALLELKSHHREVIILRHLCDMTSGEIAEAMGFGNPATVRKVLSRAMDELRAKLPRDLLPPAGSGGGEDAP
ncbi:MAG: sigma-70 family RNA polymerase sigma factor [Planctomycetes bacterium]|nr:sigma-70 family RNA polymerase sigma factor [Planctomycetota bacterium]